MEKMISALIKESKYELFHYPLYTKKQDLKYLVKRVLKPKDTPKRDSFFWPHAMLAQALEEAGELETLVKYFDAWIEKGLPIINVDNIMNGYSLLYVYEKTEDAKYRQAADKLYQWTSEYGKQMGNPMPYRKHHPNHVYVDGLGMVVPFLCRYGAMFHKKEAIDMAVAQVKDFLSYGMDNTTGLPYHGYDTKTKEKHGIIGWGRAVGWLMLAMADSIEYISDEDVREEYEMRYDWHPEIKTVAEFAHQIESITEWTVENISAAIQNTKEVTGNKGKLLFMPIRIATTGQMHGPELPNTIHLLGKETVLNRIK